MAEVCEELLREAAFQAFEAEFTRNGFNAPEGLLSLLKQFRLRPSESPEEGRARLYSYKRLWALLWFGSNKTLGAHLGKPTYVWPYTLKRVVREVIPGDQVDRPDPTHTKVYMVTIADLAAAKWPAVR